MPLSDDVKQSLGAMGYTHPTPVQHTVYEPMVRGADLVIQARTGTGKTAAFGIPLADQVIRRGTAAVQALVLAPTRELALQVSREVERIGQKRGIKVVAIYGGAPMQPQIDAVRGGAQMVVGTPGRVLDHLRRGTLDVRGVRVLVLDEADEMLSMGFERELSAILEFVPVERQTLLLSATIPPEIQRMASERLRNPEYLILSGDHVGALEVMHYVYFVHEDKTNVFLRILEVENPESAIVFCNTRDETERLAGALGRAGFDADWLNGDLPQGERESVMRRTKEGKLRFLVATDVAARGIDISHLTHVINYDFPETPEMYVHRTGRTGRMGRTGTAISLIQPQAIGALYYLRLTYKIKPFEKQIPSSGELRTRAEADLVGMLAEAFASSPPHPDDVALARRLLTHDRAESIIAGLLRSHLGERARAQDEASASRRAKNPRLAAELPVPQPPPPRRRYAERTRDAESRPREIDRPREPASSHRGATGRHARRRSRELEGDGELPRYELTPMPEHEAAPAERPATDADASELATTQERPPFDARPAEPAPAPARGHAALVDWVPPAEDNDDLPILSPPGESIAPPEATSIEPQDQAEIFVNVGRREGVHTADVMRLLTDEAGLDRSDVARVRIRDRHSFVVVRRDCFDKALAVLNGARLGGKSASAEAAKPRAPSTAPG
jgi:ATP-dependent RNA helicase DeaD